VLTSELSRSDVEDFLYDEAELLSAWRWDDWLALFVEGARYEIPTFDARHLDGRVAQFFISDDWPLLQARITRMKSKHAHAENPPSHTHRLISNVRHRVDDDGTVRVRANFIVHRVRDQLIDPYVGRYDHELVAVDGALRFRLRRAVLLTEQVRPGTRLSFIL
jgi:p-cumate 2,3-dioxygenase beta subunit